MEGLQNLIAARAIIAKEENWCAGWRCQRRPDGVLAFCALGALEMANDKYNEWGNNTAGFGLTSEMPAIELLYSTIPQSPVANPYDKIVSVARHNNQMEHAEVLAWFDRTIAKYDGSARRQKVIDGLIDITAQIPVKVPVKVPETV